MRLVDPTPYFLDIVGFYPLFPVSRRNLESARARWPESWEIEWMRPENLVTNGPFTVAERRVNDRIRLVKNSLYWDADNVAFETVDVLAIEQDSTMLNMYLMGGASTSDRPDQRERRGGNDAARGLQCLAPYMATYYYRVNVTKPPFDDVARAEGAERSRCRGVRSARTSSAWGRSPPTRSCRRSWPSYSGAPSASARDAEKARKLLAEAGYGAGRRRPSRRSRSTTTRPRGTRRSPRSSLARGRPSSASASKLRNEEWKVYLDTQATLRYDLSRSSWIGDYADPNTYIDVYLSDGENNRTGWGQRRIRRADRRTRRRRSSTPPRRMQPG